MRQQHYEKGLSGRRLTDEQRALVEQSLPLVGGFVRDQMARLLGEPGRRSSYRRQQANDWHDVLTFALVRAAMSYVPGPAACKFSSWAYRAFRMAVAEELARQRRRRELGALSLSASLSRRGRPGGGWDYVFDVADSRPAAEEVAARHDNSAARESLGRHATPREWRAAELVYIDGITQPEAAEMLGITPAAVCVRLREFKFRARAGKTPKKTGADPAADDRECAA